MGNLRFILILIILFIISPYLTSANFTKIDLTDIHKEPNLLTYDKELTFQQFSPMSLDNYPASNIQQNSLQNNLKNFVSFSLIKWRLIGGEFSNIYPNYLFLQKYLYNLNKYNNFTLMDVNRYQNQYYISSITGYSSFLNNEWLGNFWDIYQNPYRVNNNYLQINQTSYVNSLLNNYNYSMIYDRINIYPDFVIQTSKTEIITLFATNFIDHDKVNFEFNKTMENVYLQPIFLPFKINNTYNAIYYRGNAYGNGSMIPLTNSNNVVPKQEIQNLNIEPIPNPSPLSQFSTNTIAKFNTQISMIVIATIYYKRKLNLKNLKNISLQQNTVNDSSTNYIEKAIREN